MTQDEWWKLAERTVPELPEYAHDNRRAWDKDKAAIALTAKDAKTLWQMFDQLWEDLPDSPSIRFGAFFLLCDLCSEYEPSF